MTTHKKKQIIFKHNAQSIQSLSFKTNYTEDD